MIVTKKFESQTQIFRTNITTHDTSLQKHFTMIEEQRTKGLQLNEKLRE